MSPGPYALDPALASDPTTGESVVAWGSRHADHHDPSLGGILARRFDAKGALLGEELLVNSYTTGDQKGAAVAIDPATGDALVVWQSEGSFGTDTSEWSIQGRRFAADGTPVGDDFQVNSHTTGAQVEPSIAPVPPTGGFVVVWSSATSAGSDSSGSSVQGRLVGPDGTLVGQDFQINTYTTLDQGSPEASADPVSGEIVVAWSSQGSAATDSSGTSVQARRFTASGSPLSDDFQVNQGTLQDQDSPTVSAGPGGDFVVAWRDTAPSRDQINARFFSRHVFSNQFETGDTSGWARTGP
jgi:hypothetical protein